MARKRNPRNLNKLQLRTLTVLQALARTREHGLPADDPGAIMVTNLPEPHGDHFHVGDRVVLAKDATGLRNEAVWVALERKGLAKSLYPMSIVLTAEGLAYDTGLGDRILLPMHD